MVIENYDYGPNSALCFWELEHHHNPPSVDENKQTKQTHVQAISSTCLLVTDAPIFYSSLEFFFNLFHKIIAFPIIYNEYRDKTAPPIRVNPTTRVGEMLRKLLLPFIIDPISNMTAKGIKRYIAKTFLLTPLFRWILASFGTRSGLFSCNNHTSHKNY